LFKFILYFNSYTHIKYGKSIKRLFMSILRIGVVFMVYDFIEELNRRGLELKKKRDMLFKEMEDFYVEIVKSLLRNGVSNVPAIAFYDVRGGVKRGVDEGIVIENGYVYYVNVRDGVKIVLENEEELRTALRVMLGDLMVLRDPTRAVRDLKEALIERLGAKN